MFEIEFKGLEMNNIGKSRFEECNVVSGAQRSGPLLASSLNKKMF